MEKHSWGGQGLQQAVEPMMMMDLQMNGCKKTTMQLGDLAQGAHLILEMTANT
jgi:hypothetical protein